MVFSSGIFFLFFLVYFCLHVAVPIRYRLPLIITGSAIFYAWWKIEYAWLPFLLAATAYYGVVWAAKGTEPGLRRRRVAATIAMLFVPLLTFKYANFIYGDVLGPFLGWHGRLFDWSLPLGVSFITFTLTAYVVDISRGSFPTGTRLSTLLAYVLFFPHLIAGPILRPHELIPQLDHPIRTLLRHLPLALAIFTLGLVKKVVFADQIAEAVDAVYRHGAGAISGPSALLAFYGFSVQIYCDFSGYTDMAIGLALALGVQLPNNFRQPYSARSIIDFWRRWHITLSHWLRDYLYIPLGGSRQGRGKEMRNVVVTMALGGLWHGANWTFVVWGLFHGLGVAATHAVTHVVRAGREPTAHRESRLGRWLGVLLTFHFVTVSWVFFRAPTLRQATEMLAAPFAGNWSDASAVLAANLFSVLLACVFFAVHRFDDHQRLTSAVGGTRAEVFWPIIVAAWAVTITVSQGSSSKFIYFDF